MLPLFYVGGKQMKKEYFLLGILSVILLAAGVWIYQIIVNIKQRNGNMNSYKNM